MIYLRLSKDIDKIKLVVEDGENHLFLSHAFRRWFSYQDNYRFFEIQAAVNLEILMYGFGDKLEQYYYLIDPDKRYHKICHKNSERFIITKQEFSEKLQELFLPDLMQQQFKLDDFLGI